MSLFQLYFQPYEAAVDWFYKAGGSKISAIRSPRKFLNEFRAAFPVESGRELRYADAPIELVYTQDFVSVRGTSTAGHAFEYPEPE